MSVNAVGNVNANYLDYHRENLKQKKREGYTSLLAGMGMASGAYFIKNNYAAIGLSLAGLLFSISGMMNSCKADKELKNLDKQSMNTLV